MEHDQESEDKESDERSLNTQERLEKIENEARLINEMVDREFQKTYNTITVVSLK